MFFERRQIVIDFIAIFLWMITITFRKNWKKVEEFFFFVVARRKLTMSFTVLIQYS